MITYLIPTAKEMKFSGQTYPHFVPNKTRPLIQKLCQKSVEELTDFYNIKPTAAALEFERLQALKTGQAAAYPALTLFNGLMYRHIETDAIPEQKLTKQVYIASALYGIIPADRPIAPHRLDFSHKLKMHGHSLKSYWREDYDHFAHKQELIISLLSAEFADVFSPEQRKRFITLEFMEEKEGQLKKHATISKKARGQFLSQALKEDCQTVQDIKELQFHGFAYRPDLSTAGRTLVFVKTAAHKH
ncbi:peroxide stress protein YaaA [Streptococcus chenjunshii]|uniref:UPF0246 protein DDV21_011240 n=1 Tax=Streptococcus chenjunshii TaxID=2173853 RepID=A0A372KMK4_9STRE|nr:peroxide stress protein YaaA [Streptococcus chenjunshii]AXQ79593.1 peroxide stress protein YaaA [Streptococcus chenjunshii]RFU51508.1 peroxide stress protein YaaA [Streptococcus chenjunshii]RFU53511.1 peroxide stress protein YaaA [Streptococcus chenjunshii]